MIKKFYIGFTIFFLSIIIMGCSLNEGTEEFYRQENVLKVEIIIPEEIETGEGFDIQALMSQSDGEVPELENIKFYIWKDGEREENQSFQPEHVGNGMYTINSMIHKEGLYFVKVEANTNQSKVLPTKQFMVGAQLEEDMDAFPSRIDEVQHESHH
ncbi:FixH family protein [Halalkalibacter alkalisediminis]|uniref:FixH family protein n=1 Tax=Halalkalibacter alkalisediminis TaxID=935616 RepID=A0ABV6NJH8_9BACI|nr:FixH family protein [Halalkalibacter alkalisediminis]